MNSRLRSATPRQYEELNPETRLISENNADVLRVYLPEYNKEQLRVQLMPSRVMKISGERPLGGNRWQRFTKEAPVSSSCDTREITAKFEGGILYVKQPKAINSSSTDAAVQPQAIAAPADGKPGGSVETPNNVTEKKEEVQAEPSKLGNTKHKYEKESRDEESNGRQRPWNAGFYRELKKRDNLKMFAVIAVVAVALALYGDYVSRVC